MRGLWLSIVLAVTVAVVGLVQFFGQPGERPRREGALAARLPALRLEKVAEGFTLPTDVQFVPGRPQQVVVTEKGGTAQWVDLGSGARRPWIEIEVLEESERGLLGLAFHPDFPRNGRFYLSYVASRGGTAQSHVAEWKHGTPGDLSQGSPVEQRIVFTLPQPYENHNGGQIAFGPDGYLYLGLGDGGSKFDPLGSGQDVGSLLGAILRLDVDRRDGQRAYAIPPDNPFLKHAGARPELWAIGLRNPWRFSFLADGSIVAADVGQGAYEEIDVIRAGDNLGWNVYEGFACFRHNPRCGQAGFVKPVHVYGHDVGQSVTGGFVYRGNNIPALVGRYVFGDFISGRFFAIELPRGAAPEGGVLATELGQWSVQPTAFARDDAGEVYVAGFGPGALYRLSPVAGAPGP